MKRFLLLVVLVTLFACTAGAQDILYRDSAIASWDAPAEPVLLTGESWEYEVYLSDVAAGDPALLDYPNFIYVGRAITETLTIDMTLYQRLEYYLVVRSVLIRADSTEILGERGDSLNDADPTSHPAGFKYVPLGGILGSPSNLRDQEM